MGVVQNLQRLLGRESESEPSEELDDSPEEGSDVQLFRCGSCETTYISEEMDECPNCNTAVGSIPTGRELGLL